MDQYYWEDSSKLIKVQNGCVSKFLQALRAYPFLFL